MGPTAISECLVLVLLLLLLAPASALPENVTIPATPPPGPGPLASSLHLFTVTEKMVHSDQVTALVSGTRGETILGTTFGLSTFRNGSWTTRHRNLDNISQGLMDDFITALAFDPAGNLWIGYSGGLQIFDGTQYRTIRDQQLLKETRIKAIQRWNNDMWVATGHAGIHRYRDGAWTWFQPESYDGPPFYEVRSMAIDPDNQYMVVATEVEGVYGIFPEPDEDDYAFRTLAPRAGTYGMMQVAKQDPLGGVFLSNRSVVVHYDPQPGIVRVLTNDDLSPGDISINDIAPASDGRLYLATDNGIYLWEGGQVTAHLGRTEGIGISPVVRTIAIDAQNRVWFSTLDTVGYFEDAAAYNPMIPVQVAATTASPVPASPSPVPTPVPMTTPPVPVVTQETGFFPADSVFSFLNPIIDPLVRAFRSAGSRS